MAYLRRRRPRSPVHVLYPMPVRPGAWGFSLNALKCGDPTVRGTQCKAYARTFVDGRPICRRHWLLRLVREGVDVSLPEYEQLDGHPIERPWKRSPWLVRSLRSFAVWCTRCGDRAAVTTPVTQAKLTEEQGRFVERHGACVDAIPKGQGSLFG